MTPKLERSWNYSQFVMHDRNRHLQAKPALLQSMQINGFMPSGAIHCQQMPDGRLLIIRGHHRFNYAKKLKLAIWYIVDPTDVDIWNLEGDSSQSWSVSDFAVARANSGDRECQSILSFQKKHNLTLGAAVALVGGESAGSGNKMSNVRNGTFRAGDMIHADLVVGITDLCRELNLDFATSSAFVIAISMAVRIPELQYPRLVKQIRARNYMLRRRTSRLEYLHDIDSIYNHGMHGPRLALESRAVDCARLRMSRKNRSQ